MAWCGVGRVVAGEAVKRDLASVKRDLLQMHARLGAASGVSWLDEQPLVMIADEVLGGWGLLKEWRQESLQPMCDVTRMVS